MAKKNVCSIPKCGKNCFGHGWCSKHYMRWYRYGDPMKGGTFYGEPLSWLKKHIDYAGDDCLIWPFGKTEGYGTLHIGGVKKLVSRIVCEHRNGPPPTLEHEAAHSCGKGHEGCLSPKHLSWKTPKENMADTLIHGTINRGKRNGSVKLSEDQVREIRQLKGISHPKIGRMYGVSPSTVSAIKLRTKWSWLA